MASFFDAVRPPAAPAVPAPAPAWDRLRQINRGGLAGGGGVTINIGRHVTYANDVRRVQNSLLKLGGRPLAHAAAN